MRHIARPFLVAFGTLAAIACSQPAEPAPVTPPTTPPTTPTGFAFTFAPPAGAPAVSSVFVAGEFNGWNTTALRMTRGTDGMWTARTPLADGQYQYKFFINGAWPSDMCWDETWGDAARDRWIDTDALGCVPDGNGGRNAVIGVGAGASLTLGFQHGAQVPADVSIAGGRLSIRMRANHGQALEAALVAGSDSVPMHRQFTLGLRDTWRGTLPIGTTSYRIVVRTAAGTESFGPFAPPTSPFAEVAWVREGVGYQIFPDRFANGDRSNDSLAIATDEWPYFDPAIRGASPVLTSQWNGPITQQHCCHQYFGGDLQGIIDRLGDLRTMGVSLLYLNPIWLAGSAHGYDTFDYTRLDPQFGDTTMLRSLLNEAHARGMKVMWDFVPNHTGVGHPAFQDAVRNGAASAFWNWFTFRVPQSQVQVGNGSHYDTFYGAGAMPKLNTRSAAVRTHLMDAVAQWTRFGFDAIRVDVPHEVLDATTFFRQFRQTAKGIDPDQYLIGEIWQRAPQWLQGDQFDALMNYAIGQDVIERFVKGEMSGGGAYGAMAQLYAEYPEASAAMQFNVIATHDNDRLLTKLGGGFLGATPSADALARQRLASAMLYAIPGVPVTWQGDDCAFLGAVNNGRDEHRYPVQWDRCDATMRAHYVALGQQKAATVALRSPVIRLHQGAGSLLAWFRGEPGASEVLAAFNAGASSAALSLPTGTWTDIASGETFTATAAIPGRGWRYLRRS